MTPGLWITLAYGLVAVTLVSYTMSLRRRLRRTRREHHRSAPTGAPAR